jgi:hypothetical protein
MTENFNLHYYRQESELLRLLIFGIITLYFCFIILGLSIFLISSNYRIYNKQEFRNEYLLGYYQKLLPLNEKKVVTDSSMLVLDRLQNNRVAFVEIFNKIGYIKDNLVMLNKIQFDNKKIVLEGEEFIETSSANFIVSLQNIKYFKNVMLISIENTHFVIGMELCTD